MPLTNEQVLLAAKRGHLAVLGRRLTSAMLAAANASGETPVHAAAVSAQDSNGWTPAHYAAYSDKLEPIVHLLTPAALRLKNNRGETVVHRAGLAGCLGKLAHLLTPEMLCDADARGHTALDTAVEFGQTHTIPPALYRKAMSLRSRTESAPQLVARRLRG